MPALFLCGGRGEVSRFVCEINLREDEVYHLAFEINSLQLSRFAAGEPHPFNHLNLLLSVKSTYYLLKSTFAHVKSTISPAKSTNYISCIKKVALIYRFNAP